MVFFEKSIFSKSFGGASVGFAVGAVVGAIVGYRVAPINMPVCVGITVDVISAVGVVVTAFSVEVLGVHISVLSGVGEGIPPVDVTSGRSVCSVSELTFSKITAVIPIVKTTARRTVAIIVYFFMFNLSRRNFNIFIFSVQYSHFVYSGFACFFMFLLL
jgi:hypothetical protein